MFKETATIVVADTPVSADLAGEAVILDPDSGMYYGLNEVGARVWDLIQEPRMVSEIRDTLLAEYDVEPDRCKQDLFALLKDLANKGLVKIDNGADT